jgi:hypothetical protein
MQCHSGDRTRSLFCSFLFFELRIYLSMLQPFLRLNKGMKLHQCYAKLLCWLRANNINIRQHSKHLCFPNKRTGYFAFGSHPRTYRRSSVSVLRTRPCHCGTDVIPPPRLQHECKYQCRLHASSAWLTVRRASSVVPSGEGY